MHPIKPKGLVFGFWVWVFCKSLANFVSDNLKSRILVNALLCENSLRSVNFDLKH